MDLTVITNNTEETQKSPTRLNTTEINNYIIQTKKHHDKWIKIIAILFLIFNNLWWSTLDTLFDRSSHSYIVVAFYHRTFTMINGIILLWYHHLDDILKLSNNNVCIKFGYIDRIVSEIIIYVGIGISFLLYLCQDDAYRYIFYSSIVKIMVHYGLLYYSISYKNE